MGHKVNPNLFRLGFSKTWNSKWFSRKDFASVLKEDIGIRNYLAKKLKDGSVGTIELERFGNNKMNINIHTSKPGVIIGRGGEGIEKIKKEVDALVGKKKYTININIQEIDQPSLNAKIVAQQMAQDIERRIPYRRVMKQALARIEKAGAQGGKSIIAGRLDGAEIARRENLSFGKIPLHTLRADIDYAATTANTTYGAIGIKVWIYKGNVFNKEVKKEIIK